MGQVKRAEEHDRKLGRRERNKAEKRERVLNAARELFTRNGFEMTSMKAISDRADVGFGTLFLVAGSKRDLLLSLFQNEIAGMRGKILRDVDYNLDITDIFSGMLYGYFDIFAKNAPLSRDYIREVTFAAASGGERQEIHFGEFFVATARSVLGELRQQGRIKEDLELNIVAETLYATFMGAIRTWLRKDNPDSEDGKAYLRSVYEIVVFGIK